MTIKMIRFAASSSQGAGHATEGSMTSGFVDPGSDDMKIFWHVTMLYVTDGS
jgi:hypothetical protein